MREQIIESVLNIMLERYHIQSLEALFGTKTKQFVELRGIFCYSCLKLGVPNVVISEYLIKHNVNSAHTNISRTSATIRQRIKTDEILNSEISAIIAECSQRMRYGRGL